MAFSAQTSGDLIADRRFAWGVAAFAGRDFAAARDLFAQALEIAPNWPPAHWKLGLSLLELGEPEAARAAFAACLARDPEDRLGAGLQIARLEGRLATPSDAYVAALFDDYAPRFDRHLTETLDYRAPQLIAEALLAVRERLPPPAASGGREEPDAASLSFGPTLDLGCGTGLMAAALAEADIATGALTGIDLSAAMLARAADTDRYDRLERAEIAAFLAAEPPASCGLMLAADVFCYIADLAPVLAEARRVLAPGGLFAFTVQLPEEEETPTSVLPLSAGGEAPPSSPSLALGDQGRGQALPPDMTGIAIGADLRVHHSPAHIRDLAAGAGFAILHDAAASARRDRGVPVPGAIFVLAPV